MILANRSGMMIACKLVRETPKAWIVNYNDKAYPDDVRVDKNSPTRKLFDSVDEALEFIDGETE